MEAISTLKTSKFQLKHFLTRLRKSAFVKNVLVVMTGTAAAQIIGFALSPIISRLFSPSDFGVFGSFDSVSTIIAAGATLEYSQAIMLPKEKKDAINIFFVSCLCTFAVGFLCLTFCLLAPATVNGIMKTSGLWALGLLVLATLANGLNNSCQAWCVRVKAFKHTSASQVIRSLSSNGSQIGFGYFKAGAAGLIVSNVLADMLASLNLIRVLIPDLLAFRRFIRWGRMRQLAKEYRDFPMYAASQNVINALSSGLPVLLLTHFYGIVVAGAYAFGVRILQVPMGFVLRALRQVLFQKAGETQHQGGRLAPLYVKITLGLFGLAFFPSLVLFIWAAEIFTWIFGSQWQTAGEFAQSLILWLMFYFCNLPAVLFARLIRIQRTIFFYDLVLLAARFLALVFGGFYLSASQSIMLFSLVGAVMNAILILLVGHAVMKKEGNNNWRGIRDFLMEG
jgi:O-antigen/teichoic acid export membrane protein